MSARCWDINTPAHLPSARGILRCTFTPFSKTSCRVTLHPPTGIAGLITISYWMPSPPGSPSHSPAGISAPPKWTTFPQSSSQDLWAAPRLWIPTSSSTLSIWAQALCSPFLASSLSLTTGPSHQNLNASKSPQFNLLSHCRAYDIACLPPSPNLLRESSSCSLYFFTPIYSSIPPPHVCLPPPPLHSLCFHQISITFFAKSRNHLSGHILSSWCSWPCLPSGIFSSLGF